MRNPDVQYRVYYQPTSTDLYLFTEPHSLEMANKIYKNKINDLTCNDVQLVKETTYFEVIKSKQEKEVKV